MMVLVVACSFPYTPARPKRAYLDVRSSETHPAHVLIEATDSGPALAIKEVALGAPVTRSGPTIEVLRPASPGLPQADAIQVRLSAPGAYLVDVALDGGTISRPAGGGLSTVKHMVWVGTEDPLTFGVASTAGASVNVHAKAFYLGSGVRIDHVLAQLPRWATPTVQTVLEADRRLQPQAARFTGPTLGTEPRHRPLP
jgi:hypothetical protein